MHVIAFAPSLKAVLEDAGEVTTDGFPMTSAHVTSFRTNRRPTGARRVHPGGTDYDPRLYVVAKSPRGE
jgi:hypothetical protein